MVRSSTLRGAIAVSAAAIMGSCGGGSPSQISTDAASDPPPTAPSSTPTPTTVVLEGRIVLARWNVDLGADEIYVIEANGTGERQLLPGGHECPRWSPDGTRIAMTGRSAPLIVDEAGAVLQELESPDGTLILGCGTWSPDGTRYAAEGWDDADESRTGIYTFDVADGGGLTRITTPPDGGWDTPGSYSPNGRQLAFVRNGDLYLVSVDGTDERLLSKGAYGVPDWSPDGDTLVVDAEGDLVVVPVDGSPVQTISHPDGIEVAYPARWSPNGAFVAFSMVRPGPYADIWVISADGAQLVRVTEEPSVDNVLGGWAP